VFVPHFPERLQLSDENYKNFVVSLSRLLLKADGYERVNQHEKLVNAKLVALESGVFAGANELDLLLSEFSDIVLLDCVSDGVQFEAGDILCVLDGSAHEVLGIERFLINLISRMCGIASETNSLLSLVSNVDVLLTRKTLYGLIDKKAGVIGGALSHRLNLSHALMLKDNHREMTPLKSLLREMKNISGVDFIEFEVDTPDEALTVLDFCSENTFKVPVGILFDNFDPRELAVFLENVDTSHLFTEASGGIDDENIQDFDIPGLDFVSCGYLTKNSYAVDLSLELDIK